MKIPTLIFTVYLLCSWFVHADTKVWEDYDDFSGSSLDISKWEIGYWDGAQAPNIENGKAHLYGTGVGVGSIVPPLFDELVGMPQNGTNQSFLVLKDDLIRGVEAEISLDSTFSGIYLGIMEAVEGGFAYAGTELNSWKQSGPSLEFSNTIYENGTETLELTLGDKPANLGQSYKVSVVKDESAYQLFLDSELIGEYPVRGEFLFFNFGGYHDEDLPWDGYIDNVRVLRRATTTTLDGSILMLSSSDGVSETLAFENGTITSTFTDPEEGSMVTANQTYILDQKPDNSFKITLSDGDTYEFDSTTSSGTLVDYENGVLDSSGSWNFNFSRHDWEDYDDFSSGSLDSSKWDVWWGAGGVLAVVENGAMKLSGSGNVNDPASSVVPEDLTYISAENLPSKHSIALINQDDVYGVQAEFMIPSNPSDDTGLNFIFFDWAEDGSMQAFGPELEYRSENGLRTEFAWTEPVTGESMQITRPASYGIYYKMSLIHTESTNSMYLNGELIKEFSSSGFEPDTIGFAAFNDDGLPYDTYVKNVRVLRRSQEATEPDPVTVVSDPNGQAIVVQVGEEYKWSSSLDGVTLWGVEQSSDGWSSMTMRFENGRNFGNQGFFDSIAQPQPYDVTFEIDENGNPKEIIRD